jgi:hypothetical protein
MIKSYKINLLEQEINTILYLLDNCSDLSQDYLTWDEEYRSPKVLKEKIEKIINGEEL